MVILIVLLLAIRLALPYIVLHFANKTLANMPGYYGQIKDIDLALIRGAYKMDSIYLNKLDSVTQTQTQFFSASIVDLSIEWKSLLHGSIVGELDFINPTLFFTKDKVEPSEVQKDSSSFASLLDSFMPLRVNRFSVENGTIRYIDENSNPPVDIKMTETNIVARNLRNSYDSTILLPASVNAKAVIYDGTLEMNVRLNPLNEYPTFDMNAELKNTNLVKLNEFFQAYAKVDVNKGTFGLYTEAAAKEGKFSGYVKPILKDVDILGKEDKEDNVLRKIWEGLIGSITQIFTNPPEDQVATKIPFEGEIKNPQSNIWYTIVHILSNAFIRALEPALDNEISISSVDEVD